MTQYVLCETTMRSPWGICLPLVLLHHFPPTSVQVTTFAEPSNFFSCLWLEMHLDWSMASTSPPLTLQRESGQVSHSRPSQSEKRCHVLKEATRAGVGVSARTSLWMPIPPLCQIVGESNRKYWARMFINVTQIQREGSCSDYRNLVIQHIWREMSCFYDKRCCSSCDFSTHMNR